MSKVAVIRCDANRQYEGGTIREALLELCQAMGWAVDADNPFGRVVPNGARVVIKPNLVRHKNFTSFGLTPLITHPSIIREVVHAVLKTGAKSVLVADAPLQGCDFDCLLAATGLGAWAEDLGKQELRFLGIKDLRRTISNFSGAVRCAREEVRPLSEYVLFDLGQDSRLEPVSGPRSHFRVTQYDPRKMEKTHNVGRHQYLVSRYVLDADVVVNLPKLKTHKKAGITCALKNSVGINGNKEYLPHHRRGGPRTGGDCYQKDSFLKRIVEWANDQLNVASSPTVRRGYAALIATVRRTLRTLGDHEDFEGSWYGNDTVWRMVLDLNRILVEGSSEGILAGKRIRRVLHIADAIVAGAGDGPLAPVPLELGVLLASEHPAALDWVGAWMLGYSPSAIPLVKQGLLMEQVAFRSSNPEIDIVGRVKGPWAAVAEKLAFQSGPLPMGWEPCRRPGNR